MAKPIENWKCRNMIVITISTEYSICIMLLKEYDTSSKVWR
jgi:hypothetical protein